jgi:hypothetical protein
MNVCSADELFSRDCLTAGAAGLIFAVVDVQPGNLLVFQGTDTPVQATHAAAAFAAVGTRVGLGLAADDGHLLDG